MAVTITMAASYTMAGGKIRHTLGWHLGCGQGRARLAAAGPVPGHAAGVRHDRADVRLVEALDDRASFRRFCGFAAHEPTPERPLRDRHRFS